MCLTILEPNLLVKAGDTADDILQVVYGIDLYKALDPLNPKDYQTIVRRLGNSLRGVNVAAEGKAMRHAINMLDVDWPNMSAKQRDEVIRAATQSLRVIPKNTLPKMDNGLKASGGKTVKGTKAAADEAYGLGLEANFTTADKRIAKIMSKQQTNFIRDEYGRRRAGFSKGARNIVGEGLDQGLGRKEIAENLARAAARQTINRNKWYWELISSTFTNRSRTYGQLSSFTEAGIARYTFEAIVDEATSEICRYMDQKVFEVPRALQVYEEMSEQQSPEDVKNTAPWSSTSRDADGNPIIAFKLPSGEKQQVARIDKPGLGSQRHGTYSDSMLDETLARAGIMMPPLHGYCRSTILPDI